VSALGDRDLDVAVVGGGPAGLAAALLLGRARRPTLVIDAGVGRNAPSAAVHGLLGHDDVAPSELRDIARRQLANYDTVTVVDGVVTSISGVRDAFVVELAGTRRQARRLVLATGVRDELPDIDGLADLWGRSVVHCPYCHGWELRDQPLAVLVMEPLDLFLAIKLTHLSDDVVACIHNGAEVGPGEQSMLDAAGITVQHSPISRVEADGDQLRRIVFADGSSIERAGLFVHPAVHQAAPFAADLGCDLLDNELVAVDEVGQTTIPGLYAIGDMAKRATMPLPGQQVAVASAEGTITATAIDAELVLSDLPTPDRR
jgi:thioredoxin reductase